jgi:ABC-2 type transport system ATP-binding protein
MGIFRPQSAISVQKVSKTFKYKGREIRAIQEVSFDQPKGSVWALVGHNGAGKTTLIKILSTLIIPSSGEAYVNGYSVTKEEKKVRASIGLVTVSERLFYYRLTGLDNLIFFASLQGLSLSEARRRGREIMELLGLGNWVDVPYMKYSTGMQRRLALARALLTDPPVMFMDEPTLGLDPLSARVFRELIRQISRTKTILMTSHYLKEVEELASNIVVMKRGKVAAIGTPQELKRIVGKVVEVKVREIPPGMGKFVVSSDGRSVTLRLPASYVDGLRVEEEREVEPTLDDLYIYLIGEQEEGERVERVRRGGGWTWRE